MKRSIELDGARGIAIILVLIWHYFTVQMVIQQVKTDFTAANLVDTAGLHWDSWVPYWLVKLSSFTWSGVDLFFVLSGFLIGGILIDNRQSDSYFKTFFARRVCRIFPLYFLMIGLLLFLPAIISNNLAWVFHGEVPLWSYITFTQNFVMGYEEIFGNAWMEVTWSLAIEEQFYLFLPFVVRYASVTVLPWIILALFCTGPICRLLFDGLGDYVYTFCRTDALMMGVLLAWFVRQEGFDDWIRKYRAALKGVFVLLAIAVLIHVFQRWELGGVLNHLLLALLFSALVLLALSSHGGKLSRLLCNPVLVWFGLRSYGLYLVHLCFLMLWHTQFGTYPIDLTTANGLLISISSLASVLLVAELSFRYFETPFLKLGQRVKY